jgi:NAD(P)-dependent dehydrogenase (short-subunit alcohol dehydrogenase family)
VSCVPIELLALSSVRAGGAAIGERLAAAAANASALAYLSSFVVEAVGALDLLVLNAGIMAPPALELSADGLEIQFATNHLAHLALTRRLLPHLRASADARVVAVSSVGHWLAPSRPLLTRDALNDAASYSASRWYGWSKLCNILMARELNRREPTVSAYAVHPGGVQGKLLRYAPLPEALVRAFESRAYWDVDTAALTVVRPLVATGEAKLARGAYLVPIGRERNASAQAGSEELALQLWSWSEQLLEEAEAAEVVASSADAEQA